MSLLSKDVFDPIRAFLAGIAARSPAAAQAVGEAQASVSQAAGVVEAAGAAALVPLAKEGVDYVLGLVPGGIFAEPFANALIDAVTAGLAAKKTAAGPA